MCCALVDLQLSHVLKWLACMTNKMFGRLRGASLHAELIDKSILLSFLHMPQRMLIRLQFHCVEAGALRR